MFPGFYLRRSLGVRRNAEERVPAPECPETPSGLHISGRIPWECDHGWPRRSLHQLRLHHDIPCDRVHGGRGGADGGPPATLEAASFIITTHLLGASTGICNPNLHKQID